MSRQELCSAGGNCQGDDIIFPGSKITVDGDSSHEIKRHLFLGRKAMTNLDSILKSRNTTLPTKVRLAKALVFLLFFIANDIYNTGPTLRLVGGSFLFVLL